MPKYIDKNNAWNEGTLQDWYIASVDDTPPIWTPEHISELCEDFYVIPKEAPIIDAAPVVHSSWEEIKDVPHGIWDYHFRCKHCGGNTPQAAYVVAPDYCPNCGAKMNEQDC